MCEMLFRGSFSAGILSLQRYEAVLRIFLTSGYSIY